MKLDFSEISIGDRELMDTYLRRDNPQISDVSFTNLFMWRKYYKFRYTIIHDLLCIISFPEGRKPFALAPLGQINEDSFAAAVTGLKAYFAQRNHAITFEKVEEGKLKYFIRYASSGYDVIFDRNNSDYVYNSADLIGLKGKKYDGKRNHINKFKKLYQYEYEVLTEKHIDACYQIMEKWCSERECDEHRGAYCEKLANIELLNNYGRLGCKGALIKADGTFEGFTAGEMLNKDTAVIHIEKANSGINGLYTVINQQFCENEWSKASFINREQDLGVEGLRKAKLSYHPVKLVNKYTVNIM